MNTPSLRISVKNLGALALAEGCRRCFWLKLKLGFKLPYQTFPGIFSSIDSYCKRITWAHFERQGKPPPWLAELGTDLRPIVVPHHSRFCVTEPETQITLSGAPDAILQKGNGSFHILDFKTTKLTATQGELYPLYEAQLNAYAYIAETIPDGGFSPVSGLELVYYEPQTEDVMTEEAPVLLRGDGFKLAFRAHLTTVALDPQQIVLPLLQQVRILADRPQPPVGQDD